MDTCPQRARSFGAQAERYDRVRPGYPAEAVDAVLGAGAAVVADVGAGTGKLTAALISRGLHVIAVEPDPAMRNVLAGRVPAADLRDGTAEALPIDDEGVDAVCFAQAWHWADPVAAPAEAARVLRPRGTLGLLWNLDDDRVAWVASMKRLTGSDATIDEFAGPGAVPGFCAGHRTDLAWTHTMDLGDFEDLVGTWSRVSSRPEGERQEVVAGAARLAAGSAGPGGRVGLPQVAVAYRYHLAGDCPA